MFMFFRAALAIVVMSLCLGLFLACSDDERTKQHFERAGNSIEKAYDTTTNAIKDVVEGVNEAVY
jgi:hypothetical protein